MGMVLLREANAVGLWRKRTYVVDIAAFLRTDTRSGEVGYCVNGPRRFYLLSHGSRLKYQRLISLVVGARGAAALRHFLSFSKIYVEEAVKNVNQQSRSGEEITGEHADGSSVSVHGVQEEIPPSQRG